MFDSQRCDEVSVFIPRDRAYIHTLPLLIYFDMILRPPVEHKNLKA